MSILEIERLAGYKRSRFHSIFPDGMFRTLISAARLDAERDTASWRIVDCRFELANPGAGEHAYLDCHIADAVYAHLEHDLSGPVTAETGRHPLPDPDSLVAFFGRIGISGDTQVVAYDASGGAMAARLWWLLRWMGHERVAVLDGGWPAWQAIGGATEAGQNDVKSVVFPQRASLSEWVSTEGVLAAAGSIRLADARNPERFRGEVEPIDPVAGHIPGAVNLPFAGNLTEAGQFLSRDALRQRFVAAGLDDPAFVAHYCGSGVTACHNVLAMEHAGLPGSCLYAGSWSEWIRDPRRPVAIAD